MFDKILVAVDGSEHALKGVELAADMAEKYGSTLHIVSVYKEIRLPDSSHSLVRTTLETGVSRGDLKAFAQEAVDAAKQIADKHDIPKVETHVLRGQPARSIVKLAEDQGVEAIVLGGRGLGDMGGFLLGSVSHKVSSLAKCTVITVK